MEIVNTAEKESTITILMPDNKLFRADPTTHNLVLSARTKCFLDDGSDDAESTLMTLTKQHIKTGLHHLNRGKQSKMRTPLY
ncbi:Pnuc [Acrasis kona]|uniref:Pnuc n=1 Tax=Acrasis kona TaxID=1008807 RepID=A0AAW2ZQQ9_9EUKA